MLPFLLSLHFMPRPISFVCVPPDVDGSSLGAAIARWAFAQQGPLQVLCSTEPAAVEAANVVFEAQASTTDGRCPTCLLYTSPSPRD